MSNTLPNSLDSILNPSPNTPPSSTIKKRSKVSRACDSCRKKKIKCDAIFNLETNKVDNKCSNCSKNNDICQFTRIPLKRGPVKGYNKRKSNQNSSIDDTNIESNNNNNNGSSGGGGVTDDINLTERQIKLPLNPNSYSPVILPPINTFTSPTSQQQQVQQQVQSQPPPLPPQPPVFNIQRPTSSNSNSNSNNGIMSQQTMFWKAPPTDLPINSSITSPPPNRRLSIDSNFSFGRKRNSRSSLIYQSSDYSDSDEEFQNPKKLNRPFQIPLDQQQFAAVTANRNFSTSSSPRNSINKSSFSNTNSLGSINRGFQNLMSQQSKAVVKSQSRSQSQISSNRNSIQSINLNGSKRQWQEIWNNINGLMDLYYSKFHYQYPIMASKDIIMNSCFKMDHEEHLKIFELLETSLSILVNSDEYSILEIHNCFELISTFYLSSEFIKSNKFAIEIFTTCLSILNLCVLLSGYKYSFGFSISFAYFRDWLIFNEPVDNLNFNNLINIVLLDNLFSLFFGTPRGSTICFSIDYKFAINFFENGILTNLPNVNNEFLKISMNLLIYGNQLQNVNSIENLLKLKMNGLDFKFLQILNFNNELMYFCNGLNNGLNQFNSDDDIIIEFILTMELNISKFVKKLNNIIDEQIDDLEMYFNNPLVSIIIIKCSKILRNLNIFVKSIIQLNILIDIDTKNLNDPINPSFKFKKFEESINLNLNRCLNIRVPNESIIKSIKSIISNPMEISIKKVSSGGKIVKEIILLNWIRLVNDFWTSEISIDGLNGWNSNF